MTVFSIPFSGRMLELLANDILEAHDDIEESYIILPTNLSILELRKIISSRTNKSIALPRIILFEELIRDPFLLSPDFGAKVSLGIKKAISFDERLFLIARIIQMKAEATGWNSSFSTSFNEAMMAAELIDLFINEGVELSVINNLEYREDLAIHLQKHLKLLDIFTEVYNNCLAEIDKIDPSMRKSKVLEKMALLLPEYFSNKTIIVAGIEQASKSLGIFLKSVSALPKGKVILQGFDNDLINEKSYKYNVFHPLYEQNRLLDKFIKVDSGKLLRYKQNVVANKREKVLLKAFDNLNTDNLNKDDVKEAIEDFYPLISKDDKEEVGLITFLVRHYLNNTDKTVAIVTPRKKFINLLSAELYKHGIILGDSFGMSVLHSAAGKFFALTGQILINNKADYPTLLDILKHNLVTKNHKSIFIHKLEKVYLRMQTSKENKSVLNKVFSEYGNLIFLPDEDEDFKTWWITIKEKIDEIKVNLTNKLPLSKWLYKHNDMMEFFLGDSIKLWNANGGTELAELVTSWLENSINDIMLSGSEYFDFVCDRLRNVALCDTTVHPRVSILGIIEARFVIADVVIIANFSESDYMPKIMQNHWLSRRMMSILGLPSPDIRLSVRAKDCLQMMCCDTVFLSFSQCDGQDSYIPSRWLTRLESLLEFYNLKSFWREIEKEERFGFDLYKLFRLSFTLLDSNLEKKAIAPARLEIPKELLAKISSFSVSDLGDIFSSPYDYALKNILQIKSPTTLGVEANNSSYGTLVHELIEEFICSKKYESYTPKQAFEFIMENAENKLMVLDNNQITQNIWLANIKSVFKQWVDKFYEIKNELLCLKSETKIDAKLYVSGKEFTIRGKIDAIEVYQGAEVIKVVDFKTYEARISDILNKKIDIQLPFYAWMLTNNQNILPNIKDVSLSRITMVYWRLLIEKGLLKGSKEARDEKTISGNENEVIDIIERATSLVDELFMHDLGVFVYNHRGEGKGKVDYDKYPLDYITRIAEWNSSYDTSQDNLETESKDYE